MRRERPGREARRVVGVKEGKSRRDRVDEGSTVKFEKACPVFEETEEEDGHRFILGSVRETCSPTLALR